MTAEIFDFPIPDYLQPCEYEDALFWEAVADSYSGIMSPQLARRLVADAPDPDHPLVNVLKTFIENKS